MATYIPIGEPINASERAGVRQLRDELPDHYVVIGNFELQLPRRRNTLEYDAVVVGEWGVFAVEIRGWGGTICGDIRRWELEWGRVQNPFILIERKAKALRDALVQQVPDFPDELFCEAVVFLTGQSIDYRVDDPRNGRVVMSGQAYEVFVDEKRLYERGPGPLVDDATRQAVVDGIIPLASARSALPAIANIEVEAEVAAPNTPYREFRGRHQWLRTRGAVRIKAYSLDPLMSDKKHRRQRAVVVRDMEALTQLEDDPYVVHPYDVVRAQEDQRTLYLISEWVGTSTLREHIDDTDYGDTNRHERAEIDRFAGHLVEAVSRMHRRQIVHRNLHPGAVYLTGSRHGIPLKIADFDYARVADLESITGRFSQLGANGYAAPELCDDADYDHRVDIFSAGAMLFELLTGRALYDGLSQMLRHEAVWDQRRDGVDDARLREVLDDMVAADPVRRPRGLRAALDYFGRPDA